MGERFDCVIVGAGPAGIFAALELSEVSGLRIALFEKGRDIGKRFCPRVDMKNCERCFPCNLICGWGGAGAFSDGKLTLSSDVGGNLSDFVDQDELNLLLHDVDSVFVRFGAPGVVYGEEGERINVIKDKAIQAGLRFIPIKIRHLGTDNCFEVLRNMRNFLAQKITLYNNCPIEGILVDGGKVMGVRTADGREIHAHFVIVAPGRAGSSWLKKEAERLNLKTTNNPVDLGVRIEVPDVVTSPLTNIVYDPKLIYNTRSFDDKIRTFCFNPNGEVVTEFYEGIITVNGHSYKRRKTRLTNFALLVSTNFTRPFDDPISYGKYIAGLANTLSGGVLLQRLGDLKIGRRSTHSRIQKNIISPSLHDATPGDLSFVLPYRFLCNILEMIDALDCLFPGLSSPHTLLYGVEVKFYSLRLSLSNCLETEKENLFCIGDGAGITRGLIQSSASGVIAAREIKRRIGIR
jgi:hypothetical protein